MNSLNLRVSTVKTGENVRKNAEMRNMLATLPKKYENSEQKYCLQIRNAITIPAQVTAVKDIFKSLGKDDEALQFLSDLFFHSPVKHPLRNQILKLLITAARLGTGGIDEKHIIAALSRTQKQLLEEAKIATESNKWNSAVTSLITCFENFECGLKALEENIEIVFPFLCASVQKYLTELGVLSSPSVRNEYYLYIHNSIRFLLYIVQAYPQRLNEAHSEQLRQVYQLCQQLVANDDIPMDPRTNAGILIAQISKIFGEYEELIQIVKLTKNPNEIAICVGIINACSQQDFQHNSSDLRDICSKIDEIANANATIPQLLLCASRALYQISKLILNLDFEGTTSAHQSPASLDDAKLILRKLLIFSFAYIEHHMDSVRHICRDVLRNIIAAAKKIHFDFLQQKIFDACNSERLSLSMKCIVLQQAAIVLGAAQIIENCTELFTRLFATHLGNDFIVNNLFESLMIASHKELNYEAWYKQWIEYLIIIASKNDARLPDIEVLLVKAVKCEPKVVQQIIVEKSSNNIKIPISTKLSALWAVRKSGLSIPNCNETMQKFGSSLLHSILVNCDETRIMALRLLVETHKTTEMLTSLECDHILNYIEYNVNCQNPATRQKSLGLLSKALLRCELNLMKLLKDKSNETLEPRPLQLKFLIEFIRLLVNNLIRGANFSRRSVSLKLLEQSIRICVNCKLDLKTVLPQKTVMVLVETLGDSYEANKSLAVNILKLIEDNFDCSLIQKHKLDINLMEIHVHLISLRPTDSVTAAYQLEFFCNRNEPSKFGTFDILEYNPTIYAALRWLMIILRDGLSVAKISILRASKLNPLYGCLFAVRHLLQHLDFQNLARELSWRILIAEIILLCKELTNVVGPIVNSSSPEGHLPNDFSALPAEFTASDNESSSSAPPSPSKCNVLSKRSRKINIDSISVTPQMILLCAWRTIKEVSLILGEIVLRSPLQYNKLTEHFLVTKEQILEIGEHFKLLLAETKHRGAFEQAYVGFSKLCCRLWRVEAVDLNSLPIQWLREMISLISRDEQINEKICATRRSAGLPFMIQALITTELQVGSTKSLYYCMSHLIQLFSNSIERSAESRTHALNIIRALFRCAELNEIVGEFISDGIRISIRAYDAETWSERNSATLLFAALMTRIFGVQRTKDDENLNIRNKMTGRIFFLRYPKLYDFFLEQLIECTALVKMKQKAHKLHPLLLILSRLYSSALEGTESNLKLTEFIPHIDACAGCPEMQTRFLAAKAIQALTSKDSISVTILQKCAALLISTENPEKDLRLNMVHANLLQMLLLVKMQDVRDVELVGDIASTLVAFYTTTQIDNVVILKAMLDIFIELLNGLSSLTTYSLDTKKDLLFFVNQKQLNSAQCSFIYPVFRKSFFIYNLHTLRLTLPFGAISDYLLNPPLVHSSVTLEETETRLNVILLLLMNQKQQRKSYDTIMDEIELTAAEKNFVRSLDYETLSELAGELRHSQALQNELKNLLEKPLYYPECVMKSYAILSMLDHFDMTLSQLIKESRKHPGDVKSLLTLCVERIVLKQGVDYKVSQSCLEYLLEISQPWNPDFLRLKASRILGHIAIHYRKAIEKKKLTFVRLYIGLILSLLMDDDYEIRDYTTRIVIKSLSDNIEMESVVPTMAQRLFLQLTADILRNIKADDTLILDVFKIITDSLALAGASDDDNSNSSSGGSVHSHNTFVKIGNDCDIFDRNESNVFAEPLKALMDCAVIFKTTFSERLRVVSFINSYKAC